MNYLRVIFRRFILFYSFDILKFNIILRLCDNLVNYIRVVALESTSFTFLKTLEQIFVLLKYDS